GISSGFFARQGRSKRPSDHRTTARKSLLAMSKPTTAAPFDLSATNDSTRTCLTSTARYASLFMGDDLSYVVLMDTESSTLPPLRRPPLFFTIANYSTPTLQFCRHAFQQFDMAANIAVNLFGQRAGDGDARQLGNTLADRFLVTFEMDDDLAEK